MNIALLNGRGGTAAIRVLRSVLRPVAAATILIAVTGCAEVLKNPWDRYYDVRHGLGKENIRAHFNLHRGRWWNYYARGSLFLACGHYADAQGDFEIALTKRNYDTRSARTYGMHFIDYFPHRELGVTWCLQGESGANADSKKQYLEDAIEELETSLAYEESSRARFYFNRAKVALCKTSGEDTIPPTIHVNKPIYTNQRTVRFDVMVTDDKSGVGEIRIANAVGDVFVPRPVFLPELAPREIVETVELTIGTRGTMAVVAITARDLAGNESGPDRTLIVVDTQAPTAAIGVVAGDRPRTDGLVEISVRAVDDFGLKWIQAGDDPNSRVRCDGAFRYSNTVAVPRPRGDELDVRLVDVAGNLIVASIPLQEGPRQLSVTRALWQQATWEYPHTDRARNWGQPFSPARLAALSAPLPRGLMPLHTRTDLLVTARAAAIGDETWEIRFDPPVSADDRSVNETSQDSFRVGGTLFNCWDVNQIKIDGQDVFDRSLLPLRRNEGVWFKGTVDLSGIAVGQKIGIRVEAYDRFDSYRPRIRRTVWVKRIADCCREPDAIYGMLVLPLSPSRETELSDPWLSFKHHSKLGYVYELVLQKLRGLQMSSRIGQQLCENPGGLETCPRGFTLSCRDLSAFRVYDVRDVCSLDEPDGIGAIEAWYKRGLTQEDVAKALLAWRSDDGHRVPGLICPRADVDPNLIDLVLYGELRVYNTKDRNGRQTKGFQLALRALDVGVWEAKLLTFPSVRKKKGEPDIATPPVHLVSPSKKAKDTESTADALPDVYWEDLETACRRLAARVARQFPRLQAEISIDTDDIQGPERKRHDQVERRITIPYGSDDWLFQGMRLWFYRPDTLNYTKLEKVGPGRIDNLRENESRIQPERPRVPRVRDIVITK